MHNRRRFTQGVVQNLIAACSFAAVLTALSPACRAQVSSASVNGVVRDPQ